MNAEGVKKMNRWMLLSMRIINALCCLGVKYIYNQMIRGALQVLSTCIVGKY